MLPFNQYITGKAASAPPQELDRLTTRHEWFTTARRAKSLLGGGVDPALALPLMFWPTIQPNTGKRAQKAAGTEPAATVSTEDDIIGKFLEHGGYRIVPGDGGPDVEDALTAETFDDPEGELLTEELAEIYRSQGLVAEAEEIYRKLSNVKSLLNPEKSIYFADAIADIDSENNK